jgi:hypothetical protein
MKLHRRRYEAIALLATNGNDIDKTVYRPLRTGLLENDKTVREFALTATGELGDPRLIPILSRLDDGVPDWETLPSHCQTRSESSPVSSNERVLTAGDILDQIGR